MSTYTMKQFADEFKVSIWTVKNWVRVGKIKVIRLSKAVRITEEEVERIRREGIPRG